MLPKESEPNETSLDGSRRRHAVQCAKQRWFDVQTAGAEVKGCSQSESGCDPRVVGHCISGGLHVLAPLLIWVPARQCTAVHENNWNHPAGLARGRGMVSNVTRADEARWSRDLGRLGRMWRSRPWGTGWQCVGPGGRDVTLVTIEHQRPGT
jgi:hypothetical protein